MINLYRQWIVISLIFPGPQNFRETSKELYNNNRLSRKGKKQDKNNNNKTKQKNNLWRVAPACSSFEFISIL